MGEVRSPSEISCNQWCSSRHLKCFGTALWSSPENPKSEIRTCKNRVGLRCPNPANPREKDAPVKLDHFPPRYEATIEKYLEPPARFNILFILNTSCKCRHAVLFLLMGISWQDSYTCLAETQTSPTLHIYLLTSLRETW